MSIANFADSPSSPARQWATITPGAGTLNPRPKALWVNQACTITLEDSGGTSVVFTIGGAGPVDLSPTKVTAISIGTVIGLFI